MSHRPHPPGTRFPDYNRTTRTHAGESIVDIRNWPGLTLVLVGIVAMALTLTAAGYGFTGWALIGAAASAFCLICGATLVLAAHRRVKTRDNQHLRDPQGH